MLRMLAGIFMCVGLVVGHVHIAQAGSWVQTERAVQASKSHVSKFSKDWVITFTGHGDLNSKNGEILPCNFIVANKGQLVNDVTVELYRPMADKKDRTQVMIAATVHHPIMRPGETVTLQNFPVINTVDQVEFVITWKLDGRKYKQSLFFKKVDLS